LKDRLQVADMQLTGEQLVKAYWSMCTIREFEERVHKEFTIGQSLGFVHRCASTHCGHGHSIKEGAKS
jgi:TPP-dependent pyruvate/acetoin dehydrogenase alpha subunit